MPIDIALTVATLKAVAGVAKDAGKITLYSDIIGLQQTMLELLADNTKYVEENARLTREMATLRGRIADLESAELIRATMVFKNDTYWRPLSDGSEEGPFCPKCFDGEGKVSRMTDRHNGFTCCVVCNHCAGRARSAMPHSSSY